MDLIYLAHSTSIDYKKDFYDVLEQSILNQKFNFICPHRKSKTQHNSKESLKHCKYVIAEISKNKIGIGIELGWADIYGVDIICVYKKGSKISGSVRVVCNKFIEYENKADMIEKLEKILL